MAVFPKSRAEILTDSLGALDGTNITNTAPGSVTRMLLEIPAASVADSYTFMESLSLNSFLSSATGDYIDRIGVLVGIVREENEGDARLKNRINTAVRTHAKANRTSIKQAVESVDGVSEGIIAPGTAGAGSFTIYVIGQDPEETPWALLSDVVNAVSDVVAYGTHFDVLPIRYLDVNVEVEVVLKRSVTFAADHAGVLRAVEQYILRTRPGDTLSISGMIGTITQAVGTDRVINVRIVSLHVNGIKYSGNYRAGPDESFTVNRFVSTPIIVHIRH